METTSLLLLLFCTFPAVSTRSLSTALADMLCLITCLDIINNSTELTKKQMDMVEAGTLPQSTLLDNNPVQQCRAFQPIKNCLEECGASSQLWQMFVHLTFMCDEHLAVFQQHNDCLLQHQVSVAEVCQPQLESFAQSVKLVLNDTERDPPRAVESDTCLAAVALSKCTLPILGDHCGNESMELMSTFQGLELAQYNSLYKLYEKKMPGECAEMLQQANKKHTGQDFDFEQQEIWMMGNSAPGCFSLGNVHIASALVLFAALFL